MRFLKVFCFVFFAVPYVSYGQGRILSVCDRTPEVRKAIMKTIAKFDPWMDCFLANSLLHNITFLSLERRRDMSFLIISLKAGDFSGLSSLERLDLAYNNLESLPKGIFSGLSSLRYLDLSGNDLESLPAGIFSGLFSLKELSLSGNDLESLPMGIFSGLSLLNNIDLRHNDLRLLPTGVFSRLSSLKKVWLNNNSFSSFERKLIRRELIELKLEGMSI